MRQGHYDYQYLSKGEIYAIGFKPRVDITFHGIKLSKLTYGHHGNIKIRWEIDGVTSDWINRNFPKDSKDNYFLVRLFKYGLQPVKVKADTTINIMLLSENDEKRMGYGNGTTDMERKQIKGQPYMFDVVPSIYNENSRDYIEGFVTHILWS